MQEERKAIRTMREFITWYESRDEMPTNKLQEIYIKFKYIVDQEPEEKPLIIERN